MSKTGNSRGACRCADTSSWGGSFVLESLHAHLRGGFYAAKPSADENSFQETPTSRDWSIGVTWLAVYAVAFSAVLVCVVRATNAYSDLRQPSAYTFCQLVGAGMHSDGYPGLLTRSVRRCERVHLQPGRFIESEEPMPAATG